MKKYSLWFIMLIVCFACEKDSKNCDPQANWLDKMISQGEDTNGKFISVYSYTYNGKTVYLLNYELKCCDLYTSQLFDSQGQSLCFPYGGITGHGDTKCDDFDLTKKDEKLYWKLGK